MCWRTYDQDSKLIIEFLENNPEIKDECLNLFIEFPILGIKKLKEYLDDNGLWCTMLAKKQILNEIKWELDKSKEQYEEN